MKVNAGYDWQAAVMGNAAASGAGTGTCRAADQIALTTDAATASATDTTLPSEYSTAGGGFLRAAGTYAHTTAATTYTLTKTFTANSNDAPNFPIALAKMGVLNATSTGTLVWESKFAATATIAAIGDAVTVTETITM